MRQITRFLAVSVALLLILTGCITGDDDSEDESSPGGAISTLVSGIGDDEDEGTEEAEDDDDEDDDEGDPHESTEEDQHDTTSGVVWVGEGDSGDEEYDICFVVSDDGSMITAVNDGCDDFSLTYDVEVEMDQGPDCELLLETDEDIPIENGRFTLTTNDITITGEITSDTEAAGTFEGECTVSWEASPER